MSYPKIGSYGSVGSGSYASVGSGSYASVGSLGSYAPSEAPYRSRPLADANASARGSIKRCWRCGEFKHSSEFHRDRRAVDELRSDCKPCNSAAAREWERINYTRRREQGRAADQRRRAIKRAALLAAQEVTP